MSGRISIINTGGTIGMMPSEGGYAPVPGALSKMLETLPELGRDTLPKFEVIELDPILDSANMGPDDWNTIAEVIASRYDAFDGFVVLHGTDTMAYTASALSFMLEGLRKPVILTGSQIPLARIRTDARQNLLDSMLIASQFSIPEVSLIFGGRLFRGNRVTKTNAADLDAFASPNYAELGRSAVRLEVFRDRVRAAPRGPLKVQKISGCRVGALRLFPGIDAGILESILATSPDGLVLECYGIGNAPVRNEKLLDVLSAACGRGVVVVACSQCLEARVDLTRYETGAALARAGVIAGLDLTAEAAMTKLMYLFARGDSSDRVKAQMQTNLRGEITIVDGEAG
ncbi:MAG: asparaginase [Planctomycetota bacterium]